eukprot:CAMPEP_0183744838 /NCGR_PEP_ID=MMETSP0737-20130205/65935_1 /TAXON_ID=385413 /ORGANISM="Thalassiosira miniscula, Strain CCMP1093" /LENGTH=155 /DNA_ID=CAMNT_0025980491 /DNA_START=759 /DNA_END=1226 /DNA_ORIENTATION=-
MGTALQVACKILSVVMPSHVNIITTKTLGNENDANDNDDNTERMWIGILNEVRYFTECAVRDSYYTTQRASTIAVAAILCTIDQEVFINVGDDIQHALMSLVLDHHGEYFDSPEVLLAAKHRMQCIMELGNYTNDDAMHNNSVIIIIRIRYHNNP